MRLRTAVPFLVACAVVGALVGSLPLPLPEQLVGAAPWVSDVPPVLLAVVVLVGVLALVAAVALLRGPRRRRLGAVRLGLVTAGSLLACVVAGWSALYWGALADGEAGAAIPVLNWTWPAFATAVGAAVVGYRWGVRAGLAGGLVAVAPVVALDALGTALGSDALGDLPRVLLAVLVLDGFGVVLGSLFALLGRGAGPTRTPLPSQLPPPQQSPQRSPQ